MAPRLCLKDSKQGAQEPWDQRDPGLHRESALEVCKKPAPL